MPGGCTGNSVRASCLPVKPSVPSNNSGAFGSGSALRSVWRRRWFVFVPLLAALGVILLVPHHPVPQHGGKSLPDHLIRMATPVRDSRFKESADAVAAMGEKALPYIVSRIEKDPIPIRVFRRMESGLSPAARGKLIDWIDLHRHEAIRSGAMIAIAQLGTNAAPAATELMRIYRHLPYARRVALAQVVHRVGPAILPGLKPELTHPDLQLRGLAAYLLHQLGAQGLEAADELVAGLGGADANHRALVAQTLGRMGQGAGPQVMELLADPREDWRLTGLAAIRLIGGRSREKTPTIAALLEDPSPAVRLEAAFLLATWWPMPVAHWRERLDQLRGEDTLFFSQVDVVTALESAEDRLESVLRQGLENPVPDKRLSAATHMLHLGFPGADVWRCLEELAVARNHPENIARPAANVLRSMRQPP